jgi:hypothetical protein
MKNWFTSLNGAITLSVIALLTEMWRAFFDFQQVYSSYLQGPGMIFLGTLIYTLLFAGWAWALIGAARGSRGGLIAALAINVLFLLVIPVGTLVAYCPSPCASLWPIAEIGNWINLISGLLAAGAAALQLTRKPMEATA